MLRVQYETEEDRLNLIEKYKDKFLVAEESLLDGNFLVFADEKPSYITIEELTNKISILEAENKSLKEGLQAILMGDMQSLAYALYPEDFIKEIPEL